MKLSYYFRIAKNTVEHEGLYSFCKWIYSFMIVRYRKNFTRDSCLFDNWKNIKNKFEGQRVFLIGNGPSINQTPLYLLKNEYTVCFNRFNLLLDRLNWIPTIYITVDERVAEDIANEINDLTKKIEYCFFPDIHPGNVDFRRFIINRENIYWLNLYGNGFYKELPRVGLNGTVANVGIQVLAYLGFKEIYLLGVDMNYTEHSSVVKQDKRNWISTQDDDPNHFDPRYFGKGRKYHKPRINDLVLPGYRNAKKFVNENGIKVYNATIGGYLEVFPRININSLFNFTDEQKFHLLFGLKYRYRQNEPLENIIPNTIVVDDENEINLDKNIIARTELGIKLINKLIFSHIPMGPIFDKLIFLTRK